MYFMCVYLGVIYKQLMDSLPYITYYNTILWIPLFFKQCPSGLKYDEGDRGGTDPNPAREHILSLLE